MPRRDIKGIFWGGFPLLASKIRERNGEEVSKEEIRIILMLGREDRMKIIITDLTRFANQDKVCIAGINPETNESIRPMPYIQKSFCQKHNILPGAIIEADFTPRVCRAPHTEDKSIANLKFLGPCSSDEFKRLLKNTSFNSVEEGFKIPLTHGQKHIPHDTPPDLSIITLSLNPQRLEIVKDRYGKLRVNFTDLSGKAFHYLSITDLGFFEYAERHAAEDAIDDLNDFIHAQEELYIRLGLSRTHQSDDGRNGFWLQVNGVYTFPEYNQDIRCHA
jgi:hypothetical protein